MHAAAELAARFGSPLYVYDAALIAARIEELAQFDTVRFAQKACSTLAVLDLVRRHGAVVDAVSAGEIQRALMAGYAPGRTPPEIVYTADLFDHESLELVLHHDLPVNCGSPDMIDQYAAAGGGGREILLRINPGFGHGHSQKTNTGGPQSKHGIWHSQLGECLERAKSGSLEVTGLHMHIGSGTDLEHLSQVCGAMEAAARQVGPALHTISAGGGLPVPYKPNEEFVDLEAYFKLWNDVRDRLAAEFDHPISLEIEPGRFLTAESGSLITEIRAVKKMGDNLFYLVDAGFNNLARPILYGAYHPISVAPGRGKRPLAGRPAQEVIVGGPLCESGDIFTQEEGGVVARRNLPQAEVGDFLVIENAGAYGFCMSSNYNSKPFAAEVLIEDGTAHLIRERQTIADLVRGESIPGAP